MSCLKVGQVEHENLVSNELINFHHRKITKLTFRVLALCQSDSGFNSSEAFIPEFFSQLKFDPNQFIWYQISMTI